MSALMRCIESFDPCETYVWYVNQGYITPEMSLYDFLSSRDICRYDKEWVLEHILAGIYDYLPIEVVTCLINLNVYFYGSIEPLDDHMEDIQKYINTFKEPTHEPSGNFSR